jgi:hypothetical protein
MGIGEITRHVLNNWQEATGKAERVIHPQHHPVRPGDQTRTGTLRLDCCRFCGARCAPVWGRSVPGVGRRRCRARQRQHRSRLGVDLRGCWTHGIRSPPGHISPGFERGSPSTCASSS